MPRRQDQSAWSGPSDDSSIYSKIGQAIEDWKAFYKKEFGDEERYPQKPSPRKTRYQQYPFLIANKARIKVGSDKWERRGSRFDENYPWNSYKCNLFVSDVIEELGIPLEHPREDKWGKKPPMAGDWADRNRPISGWRVLEEHEQPMAGDVAAIAKASANSSGHVGFVSGPGTTISANSTSVVENDWGFRPEHKGKVVFRRYVGMTPNR